MVFVFGIMTVDNHHITLNTIPLCFAKGTSFSEEDKSDVQIFDLNNISLFHMRASTNYQRNVKTTSGDHDFAL